MHEHMLANRMSRLGGESAFQVFAKAKGLEALGRHIIHFEIGEPDFNTPKNIVEAGKKALDSGFTHYTAAQGYLPLREAIVTYADKYKKIKTHPDEVVVTPGGKPIMYYAIMAAINPGDEVIYPNPGFPIYESLIRFVGGVPIPLPLREENDFRVDKDELKSLINAKTKMIIINSPANPTGGVLTEEDVDEIAKLVIGKNIYVLSDEIYDRIIYEGSTKSMASIPEMKDWTIVLDGFSKTYAMTGWRLGYGIMNKYLAKRITDLMINSNSCTAQFTQIAGIEALMGSQEAVDSMNAEYLNRRNIIVEGLNRIKGFSCKHSPGAFYAFPNIKETGMSSGELSDYLLETAGVAVLSGSAFGVYGEGHLRLSYATSINNIQLAIERLDDAMRKL